MLMLMLSANNKILHFLQVKDKTTANLTIFTFQTNIINLFYVYVETLDKILW